MTYEEFTRLCQEQWLKEYRGDVFELHLTIKSAEVLILDAKWLGKVGLYYGELQNPVTRSGVRVVPGAARDTAIVSHGQLGEPDEILL